MDLTGDIATAVDGAAARGHALVLGYIADDGYPAVSFRGSTQVRGPQQLAIWARKADDGFAGAIVDRPQVSLLFYEPESPGLKFLTFRGRARVEPSANDEVYANIIDGEKAQDPDRNGVAVVIDVDSVSGFGPDGPFQIER
jgi:pyridoxamine 5'-phosphate oxidase-like protein